MNQYKDIRWLLFFTKQTLIRSPTLGTDVGHNTSIFNILLIGYKESETLGLTYFFLSNLKNYSIGLMSCENSCVFVFFYKIVNAKCAH